VEVAPSGRDARCGAPNAEPNQREKLQENLCGERQMPALRGMADGNVEGQA